MGTPKIGRIARTPGGQFARKTDKAATSTSGASSLSRSSRPQRAANLTQPPAQRDIRDFVQQGPPAKRLKLSPPEHAPVAHPPHTPATVNTDPKPPTKLAFVQPHGNLIQTINGVRKELGINTDDISSRDTTPGAIGKKRDGLLAPKAASSDKRSLRSQGGASRLKSELATFFPNYEDIINDAPKTPEFLEFDAPIYILDEPVKHTKQHPPKGTSATSSNFEKDLQAANVLTNFAVGNFNPTPKPLNSTRKPSISSTTASSNLNGAQVADLSLISRNSTLATTDPLGDDVFLKAHKRQERKEKQVRSYEKEKAMHEKVQLERLLDDLLGHDWLRVMGITGVTDSESKKYEPKRDYFIAEVRALLDKFRIWKEEEKRLRLEKEEHRQEEEEEEEEDGADTEDTNSSDIDAKAARQLLQEAGAAPRKIKLVVRRPPSPDKPFTSFYDKPHLRAAAMGKLRHGRSVTAFGHPIPDLRERDFALPPEYVTPEALRASARRRRILKRTSKE